MSDTNVLDTNETNSSNINSSNAHVLTYKAFIEEDGCLRRVTTFYGIAFPESTSLEEVIRGTLEMREQLKLFYIHERDMDMFNRVIYMPTWNVTEGPEYISVDATDYIQEGGNETIT